jgi:hypothetical protein
MPSMNTRMPVPQKRKKQGIPGPWHSAMASLLLVGYRSAILFHKIAHRGVTRPHATAKPFSFNWPVLDRCRWRVSRLILPTRVWRRDLHRHFFANILILAAGYLIHHQRDRPPHWQLKQVEDRVEAEQVEGAGLFRGKEATGIVHPMAGTLICMCTGMARAT